MSVKTTPKNVWDSSATGLTEAPSAWGFAMIQETHGGF